MKRYKLSKTAGRLAFSLALTMLAFPAWAEVNLDLKGIVSKYDGPSPDGLVERMVDAALEADAKREAILKKEKQTRSLLRKTMSNVGWLGQLIFEYRGFESSSEAADVILNEKERLKGEASVAYVKQKQLDELHSSVFSSLMQISEGLGMAPGERREKALGSGLDSLKKLVGEEPATQAFNQLKAWSQDLSVPTYAFDKANWSVMEISTKQEEVLSSAVDNDPVVNEIRRALHRYNTHNNLTRASSKIINTTLTIASLSPTLLAPAAQLTSLLYSMATGGPEDAKLLKELYLDKRLESRWKRLNQESSMALNAYNTALLTRNPILLGFSESAVTKLAGEPHSAEIFGGENNLLVRREKRAPEKIVVQTHSTL